MHLRMLIGLFFVMIISCKNEQSRTQIKVITEAKVSPILNDSDMVLIDSTQPVKIKFYTIDSLDIMNEDLGIYNYYDAEKACINLKDGWRLPTAQELNIIYTHSDDLGKFKTRYYLGGDYSTEDEQKLIYRLDILNGDIELSQSNEEINSRYGARLIRKHIFN